MMENVTVRGSIQLQRENFGASDAPFVLLVAGAGAPAQFWPSPFCQALAQANRHVVRYCHRDTGLSTHFSEPYDINELLLDMMALLPEDKSVPVHLIGHSMGGFLAQMAMCRYPGRFASVTSISSGPTVSQRVSERLGLSRPSAETWGFLKENKPTGNFDADLPGWIKEWKFLNGRRAFDEPAAIAYTRSLYVGERNFSEASNHMFAVGTIPESLPDELKLANCRFLALHGDADPLVPVGNGKASARLVPGGQFRDLDGAGHMFFDALAWREILLAVIAQTKNAPRRRGAL
jgi:pimeloyl-ACP methyl ester carboxylesterase